MGTARHRARGQDEPAVEYYCEFPKAGPMGPTVSKQKGQEQRVDSNKDTEELVKPEASRMGGRAAGAPGVALGDALGADNRIERLIASQEASANAMNRLVQVLESQQQGKRVRAARQRRMPLDKPITVTPLVAAATKRALARLSRR